MQFVLKTKDTKRSRERSRRLKQVAGWLQSRWPAPTRSLTVLYVDEITDTVPGETVKEDPESLGSCQMVEDKDGKIGFDIQVRVDKSLATEIETLIHEWGHVLTHAFTTYHKSQHCDEYWLAYGRMYRGFYEGGGDDASRGM